MNAKIMLTATAALACLSQPPISAQEIAVEEDVSIDRRIAAIDKKSELDRSPDIEREVHIVRRRSVDGALADQIDAMEEVELRIVKMGEGADIDEAELRALTERRIADGEMVVFNGREMECERQATGVVRLEVCSSEGRKSVIEALREARATLADDAQLGIDAKARALAALDRRIVELEVAGDR